jgi:hypothetical protein
LFLWVFFFGKKIQPTLKNNIGAIFWLLFFPTPITTHKIGFCLDNIKKLNTFFEDWMFGHKVVLKPLEEQV